MSIIITTLKIHPDLSSLEEEIRKRDFAIAPIMQGDDNVVGTKVGGKKMLIQGGEDFHAPQNLRVDTRVRVYVCRKKD